MKTKSIFIKLIAMLAISALVFQSCIKNEDITNTLPTCNITSPSNGQEITKGETIIFSVDANDSDGNITEVLFFINDIAKGSVTSTPYSYSWNSGSENIGFYILKATSVDNSGDSTSDEITIELVEGGSGNTFTDLRDGQVYNKVVIGSQTWMAENLNYTTENSWCNDDNSANCAIYGRLYDWETLMNGASSSNSVPSGVQGLCPAGWHIPSEAEWLILIDYLGVSAGGLMKSTTGWDVNDYGESGNGTNTSGFTALPGGLRQNDGSYFSVGPHAYFWSSTEYLYSHPTLAWEFYLSSNGNGIHKYDSDKTLGMSVRCLKD